MLSFRRPTFLVDKAMAYHIFYLQAVLKEPMERTVFTNVVKPALITTVTQNLIMADVRMAALKVTRETRVKYMVLLFIATF